MRLTLVEDDGTVIDSVRITKEEWDNMSGVGALSLLDDLRPIPFFHKS